MASTDLNWAWALFQAGGLGDADGISVHPYNYPGLPETSLEAVRELERVAQLVTGGREVPIYVSEIGWTTSTSPEGIAPSLAADYLARYYLLAPMNSYIKAVLWYDIRDDGSDITHKEHNFGLQHLDWSPKPGSCAMAVVGNLLKSVHADIR